MKRNGNDQGDGPGRDRMECDAELLKHRMLATLADLTQSDCRWSQAPRSRTISNLLHANRSLSHANRVSGRAFPPNRGKWGVFRGDGELGVSAGLRGGAGRTRTGNQTV